jgi:prefoldin subunit 5
MKTEQIDLVQTIGIGVIAGVLIFVVWRLEQAFALAAARLGAVVAAQAQIQAALERALKRIDELEREAASINRHLIRLAHENPPVDH